MPKAQKTANETNLEWEGESVSWPTPDGGGILGIDSNLWMCAEDARLEVWSHFRQLERRYGRRFTPVHLTNCSEELHSILESSLPYGRYSHDLMDAVGDFLPIIARQLILRGSIAYEIRFGWNRSVPPPRLDKVKIRLIPNHSLFRVRSRYFQVVPAGVLTEESPGRVITIKKDRIISFRPPPRWRAPLRKIRAGLPVLGHTKFAWLNDFERQNRPIDFKEASRCHNVELARLTAPIGWNARHLFRDEIADFQWTLRELRWKKFCIELRDSILETIAIAFERIGQRVSERPLLEWQYLPTVEQVEREESKLMQEGKPFREVLASLENRTREIVDE